MNDSFIDVFLDKVIDSTKNRIIKWERKETNFFEYKIDTDIVLLVSKIVNPENHFIIASLTIHLSKFSNIMLQNFPVGSVLNTKLVNLYDLVYSLYVNDLIPDEFKTRLLKL